VNNAEISIVVPVYNEEENIAPLYREIKAVCEREGYQYEVIFVDDGSNDGTAARIEELEAVKCVTLRRNFGQTAAMDAGIRNAQYDILVTIDGDRQNDPEDIPRLLAHLLENKLDVVCGWRKERKDPFFKRFASRGANLLRGIIVRDNIHDSGCSLKIYRRECFDEINLYGEMHRFIPAICLIKGFRVGELVVNHRPRVAGKTKYDWKRTVKGFLDMLALWFWGKYSSRPLHLFGSLGLLTLFGAFCSGIYTIYQYFERGGKVSDTGWLVLTMFLIFTGIQLFSFGIIADILAKSYHEVSTDKSYSIKKVVEKK
jgi:glycosyltransferase involved in cell wall biosynthesis